MKNLLLTIVLVSASIIANASPIEVAQAYFSAFANKDAATMGSLYAENTQNVFSDAVFPNLNTLEARNMWKLLLSGNSEFAVAFQIVRVTDSTAVVNWQARYVFPPTGNRVLNRGQSNMKIINNRIVEQRDSYDLCAWTSQALPPVAAEIACRHPDFTLRPLARHSLNVYIAEHN